MARLRAVLLLENRLIRGALTADRLDAVTLIAGQLAVSLDNAQLYAELTTSRPRIVTAADHGIRSLLSPAEAHVKPADVHASQPDDSAPAPSRP
ncbi:hypothetical protein ACTXG6_43710 [Pseudonocardia sp. Cha107L01]|uniref:hypothetical protein n=1 Tax=Pseudonocardia sp. Cha107L01 TaxID=3457576 RepID=UPI00403EED55